ncbi:MAG: SPOR domain-containing protein [Lysobacteraceae bacterium]
MPMLSRALIAVLLVMNLGVAAWWLLHAPARTQVRPSAPEQAPVLRLLSESEAQMPPGEEAPPAEAEPSDLPQPTPGPDRLTCLEIGPFLTQSDLRRAMGAFTPNAERIQFRETRSLANRGYWVFLPAQGSRDKALSIARELSAKGLRDYYVVTAGERENTISLGLFRDLSNAEQRHEQVRQAGFAPQLQPREDEIPAWWIDLAIDSGFDLNERLHGYTGVTAKQVPCS